ALRIGLRYAGLVRSRVSSRTPFSGSLKGIAARYRGLPPLAPRGVGRACVRLNECVAPEFRDILQPTELFHWRRRHATMTVPGVVSGGPGGRNSAVGFMRLGQQPKKSERQSVQNEQRS